MKQDSEIAKAISALTEKVESLSQKIQAQEDTKSKEKESEKEKIEGEIDATNKEDIKAERKTKPIDISVFASKFGVNPDRGQKYTVQEVDELLEKGKANTTQRMAIKHELQAAGMLAAS